MPRPSSPLSAKASVRSPYALDRSQQNSCVGTVATGGTKPRSRPHMRFVFQTMMSSRIRPKAPGGAGRTLQFTMSDRHLVQPLGLSRWKLVAFRDRSGRDGGARRDRTDDLMLAKHALYQLSYGPSGSRAQREPPNCLGFGRSICPPEVSHEVWWAQADSNCRPHAYQACALTN